MCDTLHIIYMRGILLWSRHNKNLVDFQKNLGLVRHKKLWAGRRGKVFVLPAQLPRWGATGACMWSRSCGPSEPYPQLPGLPPQLSGTHLPLLSNGGQPPPQNLLHTPLITQFTCHSLLLSLQFWHLTCIQSTCLHQWNGEDPPLS